MKLFAPMVALALAACAAPDKASVPPSLATAELPADQCFHIDLVNGYATDGPGAVNIRARVSDIYRLELETECPGIGFGSTIGLKRRAGSTGRVCSPRDVDVVTARPNVPVICAVRSIRRLDAAQVAALTDSAKP